MTKTITTEVEYDPLNAQDGSTVTLQSAFNISQSPHIAGDLVVDGNLTGDNLTTINGLVNGVNINQRSLDLTSHTGNAAIHFTEGSIDHTNIQNVGTNSHGQIDTHIADATIHFTEGSINHTNIQNVGTNTHAQIDTFMSTKGNADGLATLDSNRLIPSDQLPALAITSTCVCADEDARDALDPV